MAREQLKTQVLVLHSEQSTLDTLCSVIDDRFAVHRATTGTEALHTLGETPIHVIISAQKLPGMSGIEALREAKKRSPETTGILLAGRDEVGLEALVGEKEVFQIVQGEITSSDLNQLIDSAAQQMRLLSLAHSANDTAANVDLPETEHIVMETADNGCTIISDGTGTWSALDPGKTSTAQSSDPRIVDILVLTRDEEFLATVQQSSRGLHNVRSANTLAEAEQAFSDHAIGVAVVDAAMPGPKVEMLTQHLRTRTERLVCVVAGRRDDGEMLMDLINRGKVYRFLLKPVSPGRARLAIEASAKHHREAPDSAFKLVDAAAVPPPEPEKPLATGAAPASKREPIQAGAEKSPVTADADEERAAGESTPGFVDPETQAGNADTGFYETGRTVSLDNPRGDASFSKPKWLASIAGCIALVAAGFYLYPGSDDSIQMPPPASQQSISTVDDPPAAARVMLETVSPTSVGDLLTAAETAVLERRYMDAAVALDELRLIEPQNARLPFLAAQVSQMRVRIILDDARASIRESRFDDAAKALLEADALGLADTSEIEAVALELSTTQNEQRAEDFLDRAAASIDAGKLIAPKNNNAMHYYRRVLTNDPDNTTAKQGLKVIAAKLVLEARDRLDLGQLDQAAELLEKARRLDPASSEIAASSQLIADARQRIDEQLRQEEARRKTTRAEAERLAENQATTADPDAAKLIPKLAAGEENSEAVASAIAATSVQEPELSTNSSVDGDVLASTDNSAPDLTEPSRALTNLPVPVSSLTRTVYVAPKFPNAAVRRNQSGWVDAVFTVSVDGATKDIEIRNATPGDVFVNAATRALEKWEFEPILENGEPVEGRASIRMLFAIEQ